MGRVSLPLWEALGEENWSLNHGAGFNQLHCLQSFGLAALPRLGRFRGVDPDGVSALLTKSSRVYFPSNFQAGLLCNIS